MNSIVTIFIIHSVKTVARVVIRIVAVVSVSKNFRKSLEQNHCRPQQPLKMTKNNFDEDGERVTIALSGVLSLSYLLRWCEVIQRCKPDHLGGQLSPCSGCSINSAVEFRLLRLAWALPLDLGCIVLDCSLKNPVLFGRRPDFSIIYAETLIDADWNTLRAPPIYRWDGLRLCTMSGAHGLVMFFSFQTLVFWAVDCCPLELAAIWS